MTAKNAPNRRRRPLQARSTATVEAILEATAQVLETRGYEGTTTNRIAGRAGVSVGSLYQYFPSKDALIAALVERHFAQLTERVLATLDRVKGQPVDQGVQAIIDTILSAHRHHCSRHQVFDLLLLRVDGFKLIDRFLANVEEAVAEVLRARQDAVRPRDPDLAARILCRAVSGVVRSTLRRAPEQLTTPEFQRELATLVRGFLVSG